MFYVRLAWVFLLLASWHLRFVWMFTGVALRVGFGLGLDCLFGFVLGCLL